MQDVRFIVSAANFKQGFCPKTYDDLLAAIVANLAVTPNQDYSTFVQGNVEPTSNMGPWLKDGIEWWVFRNETGKYEPMTFSSVQGFVDIGSLVWWAGTIAGISGYWDITRWVHCDGRALSRTTYSELFARIGVGWGVGDGVTTFNIPDQRNNFIVGASADSAGAAMTTVTDGATLTKSRAYQPHKHARGVADPATGGGSGIPASGNEYSTDELDVASDNVAEIPTRVIPPFNAWVPLFRIR